MDYKNNQITVFPEIFQVCTVIPELVFCIPFNISALVYLCRTDLGNVSFYSSQNTVEQ